MISSLLTRLWALLDRRSSSNSSTVSIASSSSNDSVDSSIQNRNYRYDVFISFRGPDTRHTFVDHLHDHLLRKGIFVFKDDTQLQKGESIPAQLLQAIQDSRLSIIVFSQNYASSTWCLDEMAAIADCKQQSKQTVFPVFYGVDPSHVRHQNGAYKPAFVSYKSRFREDPDKVDRWARAMTYLANSGGWDLLNKPEVREIKEIVQEVIKRLGHKFCGFVNDLIGIQSLVEALEGSLKLSSNNDNVRVLGIWGMGGIGKTTQAVVLYDRISYKFDACCFIENVSKIYRDGGATAIQKQILRQTLEEQNLDMYSPFQISGIVTNRLHNIKVLIVLDNVDQIEQLEDLAIDPEGLLEGSRIIITTRDEHILKEYGARVIHNVSLMNDNDACELFCSKAFRSEDQSSSCVELIPEVLKYVQGLPLAIKVIGSFLYARNATQWKDALDRFENSPDNGIMDVLQISVDGLQDEEKEIFLHIACFFKEEREDYAKRILNYCGLHTDIGIPRLIEKSLITLRDEEIHMHDMLQELGKKIVRNQFPEQPGSWSRIWLYKDFFHVMTTQTGTNNVKAVVLKKKDQDMSECSVAELSEMKNLRLLILYHKGFSGGLDFLSSELRYLLWHDYPFTSLPSSFAACYLEELNMPGSSIICLWKGQKDFPCLKRMDLSNSKYLVETPDFSGAPNLERLDLSGCTDLVFVDPSMGRLENLVFLSFRNCNNLNSIKIGFKFCLGDNNISLRVLHFSGCTKLENTPDFARTTNLEYLDFDGCTSLSSVHESIGALAKLTFLSFRDCKNLVSIPNYIKTMTSLQTLDLWGCLKLKYLPFGKAFRPSSHLKSLVFLDMGFCNLVNVSDAIGELMCLERLNLQGNNFVSIPDGSLSSLDRLAYLNLSHCHKLKALPLFPSLNASSGGRYFQTVSGSRDRRSGLYVFDCPKLQMQVWGIINFELAWLVRLIEEPCNFRCGFDIVVPLCLEVILPRWLLNQGFNGDSVIRITQFNVDDSWMGFVFCVAFEQNNNRPAVSSSSPQCSFSSSHPFHLSFESEYTEECFDMPLNLELNKICGSEHLWIIYISREHCHFVKTGAHITFKAHSGVKINAWGMKSIFRQEIHLKRMQQGESLPLHPNDVVHHVDFESVEKSNNNSGPKFQLPYNWLVTEADEVENISTKAKETNLSYAGL